MIFKHLFKNKSRPELELIRSSFPAHLSADIDFLFKKYPFKTDHFSNETFNITLHKEEVNIPYRVYFDKNQFQNRENLSLNQSVILNCILTRHNNGWARETALKEIITSDEYWISPFIIQLVGEYVFEILQLIYNNLDLMNFKNIKSCIKENPDFLKLTEQRVISYWDCYFRYKIPKKYEYIGFKIIERFKEN